MRPDLNKCHVLVTTNAIISVNINGSQTANTNEEKLRDIKFDSELSFESHVPSSIRRQVKNYMQ